MSLVNLGRKACVIALVEMPFQPPSQKWALLSERPLLCCLFELEQEGRELAEGRPS